MDAIRHPGKMFCRFQLVEYLKKTGTVRPHSDNEKFSVFTLRPRTETDVFGKNTSRPPPMMPFRKNSHCSCGHGGRGYELRVGYYLRSPKDTTHLAQVNPPPPCPHDPPEAVPWPPPENDDTALICLTGSFVPHLGHATSRASSDIL